MKLNIDGSSFGTDNETKYISWQGGDWALMGELGDVSVLSLTFGATLFPAFWICKAHPHSQDYYCATAVHT